MHTYFKLSSSGVRETENYQTAFNIYMVTLQCPTLDSDRCIHNYLFIVCTPSFLKTKKLVCMERLLTMMAIEFFNHQRKSIKFVFNSFNCHYLSNFSGKFLFKVYFLLSGFFCFSPYLESNSLNLSIHTQQVSQKQQSKPEKFFKQFGRKNLNHQFFQNSLFVFFLSSS